MSFDRSRLDPNGSASSGIPTQGNYQRPTETLATIAAAGYFNEAFDIFKAIAVLRVTASDGTRDYLVSLNHTNRIVTLTALSIIPSQIAFPAPTLWTPVLGDEGGLVTGVTYDAANRYGVAWKWGPLVFLQMRITLTSKGTGYTGGMALRVNGLPYPNFAPHHVAIPIELDNTAFPAGRTQAFFEPLASASYAHIAAAGDAVGHANLTGAELTNTSAMYMAGCYLTSA